MRYFIKLSYNGEAYHGWQVQPNAITVQEVIEDALSKLLNESISITGAGRTDTGVHAKEMYAHFEIKNPVETSQLMYKLNAFLPSDIAIQDMYTVPDDHHARFSATSRTYEYHITIKKDPFKSKSAYYFKLPLDLVKMNEASELLLGYKNFKCFSRSNTDVKTYYCDISFANWELNDHLLVFTIKADRFLRNMVRAIVGTLIDIGIGKTSIDEFKGIIESENRSNAGASAPAHGLYLTQISYPKINE